MSDTDDYSLLPGNASAFERGVERAFRRLIADVEVPFPHLLDPAKTPAEFLPYLAADRSVIEWQSGDDEATKRETVAREWLIKKAAGTRAALRNAVESLGLTATIRAWHEYGGNPYEFSISALAPDLETGLSDARYARLEKRLANAVSERDTMTLTVETYTSGSTYAGAMLESLDIIDIYPE